MGGKGGTFQLFYINIKKGELRWRGGEVSIYIIYILKYLTVFNIYILYIENLSPTPLPRAGSWSWFFLSLIVERDLCV